MTARELTRARADLDRAEKELATADAAERDGAATLDRIETELAELDGRGAWAELLGAGPRGAGGGGSGAAPGAGRRAGEVEAVLEALDAEEGDADTGDHAAD